MLPLQGNSKSLAISLLSERLVDFRGKVGPVLDTK